MKYSNAQRASERRFMAAMMYEINKCFNGTELETILNDEVEINDVRETKANSKARHDERKRNRDMKNAVRYEYDYDRERAISNVFDGIRLEREVRQADALRHIWKIAVDYVVGEQSLYFRPSEDKERVCIYANSQFPYWMCKDIQAEMSSSIHVMNGRLRSLGRRGGFRNTDKVPSTWQDGIQHNLGYIPAETYKAAQKMFHTLKLKLAI